MNHLFLKKQLLTFIFFFGTVSILYFSLTAYKPQYGNTSSKIKSIFLKDVNTFQEKCGELTKSLKLLEQNQVTIPQTQQAFYSTKQAYKRIEYLVEYLDPDLAKSMNGAPLPKIVVNQADYLRLSYTEPAFVVFQPEGLQVIEEIIFSGEVDKESINKALALTYKLEEKNALFATSLINQPISEKQIFESLREELIRIMTMGITGFDSPAAGNEINNAAIAIQPVLEIIQLLKDEKGYDKNLCKKAEKQLRTAINYLQENTDFDTFDRLYFIRELANPAYATLTEFQNTYIQSDKNASVTKPVNDKALNLFSADFLRAAYYAKQDQNTSNPQIAELGKMLFFDPVLSSNHERSCASCHNPEKAFTDGHEKSVAFSFQENVPRNSPTLLNAIFSKTYFWDGRVEYLQDQVPDVVSNEKELHGSYKDVVATLQTSAAYKKLFKNAFSEEQNPLTTNTINRAIAAYIQSLVALNSHFDKYMRKETSELDASAKRGFNLFMGKAACGTCHFAPVFNGTVPPKFIESEHEVLGTTASSDFKNPKLDEDLGRYNFIKADELKNSFKTATVRNAAVTAPYMHNGVFRSLEELIEFYDEGGGVGLGLDVPNQTLPSDKLNLTAQGKADLISFLKSLTDTNNFSAPEKLPQFKTDVKLNQRVIGGKY